MAEDVTAPSLDLTPPATVAVAEQYNTRSAGRRGLKREFAFSLKAHNDLSSPMSRTRSGKIRRPPDPEVSTSSGFGSHEYAGVVREIEGSSAAASIAVDKPEDREGGVSEPSEARGAAVEDPQVEKERKETMEEKDIVRFIGPSSRKTQKSERASSLVGLGDAENPLETLLPHSHKQMGSCNLDVVEVPIPIQVEQPSREFVDAIDEFDMEDGVASLSGRDELKAETVHEDMEVDTTSPSACGNELEGETATENYDVNGATGNGGENENLKGTSITADLNKKENQTVMEMAVDRNIGENAFLGYSKKDMDCHNEAHTENEVTVVGRKQTKAAKVNNTRGQTTVMKLQKPSRRITRSFLKTGTKSENDRKVETAAGDKCVCELLVDTAVDGSVGEIDLTLYTPIANGCENIKGEGISANVDRNGNEVLRGDSNASEDAMKVEPASNPSCLNEVETENTVPAVAQSKKKMASVININDQIEQVLPAKPARRITRSFLKSTTELTPQTPVSAQTRGGSKSTNNAKTISSMKEATHQTPASAQARGKSKSAITTKVISQFEEESILVKNKRGRPRATIKAQTNGGSALQSTGEGMPQLLDTLQVDGGFPRQNLVEGAPQTPATVQMKKEHNMDTTITIIDLDESVNEVKLDFVMHARRFTRSLLKSKLDNAPPSKEVANTVDNAPLKEVANNVGDASLKDAENKFGDAPSLNEAVNKVANAPLKEAANKVDDASLKEAANKVDDAPLEEAANKVEDAPLEEAAANMVDDAPLKEAENKVDVAPLKEAENKVDEAPLKEAVTVSSNETSEESDGKSTVVNGRNGSLSTPLKKKMELKMSKKITLTKLPGNVRELLGTGLLEGLNVSYMTSNNRQPWLRGVIKDGAILCFCTSCKGTNAVSAYQFELHAGSTKKHPSDYIVLENGSSINDIIRACANAPLDLLETTIRTAIGFETSKGSKCLQCHRSFQTSRIGKLSSVCDSCLVERLSKSPLSKSTPSLVSSENISKSVSLQKKISQGRMTTKDLWLHKLVFMNETLPDGTEVGYYNRGKRLLEGYIKGSGIFCSCCKSVVSPSLFEAHAGFPGRRKPYLNIYTSNGVSLHELSVSLSKDKNYSARENDDLCQICADGGNLLLCDTCPRAFHKECMGLSNVPNGEWSCPCCQAMHQREKYVSHNKNAIAAGRVSGVDPIEEIFKRCIRIVQTPEIDASCCVLCRGHDFSKSEFGPRTVLLCDQCEKEFHIGCLKEHEMADLKELPQGTWFCCSDCDRIYTALHGSHIHESKQIPAPLVDVIMRKRVQKGLNNDSELDVRWRLIKGSMALSESTELLSEATTIFHESFDPIIDLATRQDLIPAMVYGKDIGHQDFTGMYCAVLTISSTVVSAGLLRVLGRDVAELPLVATSMASQGHGCFQTLFSCIEELLISLGVERLVLPATKEAEAIWVNKFGFQEITQAQLEEYTKGTRPMNFQGTPMLHKPIPCSKIQCAAEG